MEISKEDVFRVEYAPVLGERASKRKKRTSYIVDFIKSHKIITTTIAIFVTCLILNFALIYNFMKILENM